MYDAHDALTGKHRGMYTTLERIERFFLWRHMRKDVFKYVIHCTICQKLKAPRRKPQGLLQPLPVPDGPFHDISMDFVTNLPPSLHSRNTQCLTIVGRFSKCYMLIPCKATAIAQDIARLFIKHWYPLCGLPKSIVSDRDTKFASNFWKALFESFGTKLNFSSAFHPQSDGQTEIYNQFVLNANGRTPYEAEFGRPFQSLLTRPVSQLPEANFESRSLDKITESVKLRLSKAQESYSRQANKHRKDVTIKEGDWVYLRIMKQRLKQVGKMCPKLSFRSYDPFPIIKQINDVEIHLSKFLEEEEFEIVDRAEVMELEQILLHRLRHGSKKQQRKFFLKLKDRGTHEAVWVDEDFFQAYLELLADYKEAMQLGTGTSPL
ncbi:hypothetical protein L7F22_048413 [Adiantum nelumboides]|nr:hypothetical protein [Adiantum nelumboides]